MGVGHPIRFIHPQRYLLLMCYIPECTLLSVQARREVLRVRLTALMTAFSAGDAAVKDEFLASMEEFDTLSVDASTCVSFSSIVPASADVNGDIPAKVWGAVAGKHISRGQREKFLGLLDASAVVGHGVAGMEYFSRSVWAATTRALTKAMSDMPLASLCGPRTAAALVEQGAQAVQEARESVVEGLLDTWAGSFSYSRSEGVLGAATSSLQKAAERFIQRGFVAANSDEVLSVADRVSDAFIAAQYSLTQQFFARLGVTEVVAYRGLALRGNDVSWGADKDDTMIEGAAALSSFSLSYDVAKHFAVGHEDKRGVVISARVPVARIVALPGTGMADLAEHEVVVLTAASDRVATAVVTAG